MSGHALPQPITFGKYVLYERIGRGGMADVFKGRMEGPEGFERTFVVKRILPHLSDDPAFVRMFVEEAKLSARLNHPNVVQIFELGNVDGEYFISMEYIQGHDLAETMRAIWRRGGPPRPEMVAYVGREMCRGLAYAHSLRDERGQLLGMIHRDVSPSNVMLSFEGSVKLLDFGIAKALGEAPETTKSGTLKGKYAYMAPEQTEGDDVDHRSDIFAVGIVLHEVLTGRRLFKGANDIQTVEKVRRCDVRPPSLFNPLVPPALDAILLKALARNREHRYRTAEELAEALDDIVHEVRFTPANLAATVRDLFAGEPGAQAGSTILPPPGERTTSHPRTSSTISAPRSPTIPPVTVSPSKRSADFPGATAGMQVSPAAEAALLAELTRKPRWQSPGALVAVGVVVVGVAIAAVRGGTAMLASSNHLNPPAPAARSAGTPKPVVKQVLIQSEPEGADVFAAGHLEPIGKTPAWLGLEFPPDAPARLMLRKAGYQDKAMAVEVSQERPPLTTLIRLDVPEEAPARQHHERRPSRAGDKPADKSGDKAADKKPDEDVELR